MARRDWPLAVRRVRGVLPAEARPLRGALGLVGGVALAGAVVGVLFGGNWHMGYRHDWVLTAIFLALLPAAAGVVSPLWYWVGRPLWARVGRPGAGALGRFRGARFLPGLAGALAGVALVQPVGGTARFPVQVLAPLGIALALGAPLWYWLGRPLVGRQVAAAVPDALDAEGPSLGATGRRVVPVLAVLVVASAAVTAAIALPVAGVGESVTADGLAVTVTDARTAEAVTALSDGDDHGETAWRLLLVRVAVENRGGAARALPGRTVGDVAVLAPECDAQNFGEPARNCNQVYVDGRFGAGGVEYANYDDRQAAAGGTLAPGERLAGWLVFRIESPPGEGPAVEPMVVVDGVGRWSLAGVWTPPSE